MSGKQLRMSVSALVVVMGLSACQAGASPTTGQPSGTAGEPSATAEATPEELIPVTVVTSFYWSISQYLVEYLAGKEQGFFEDEGLDVTFQEGTGSGNAVQLVANNTVDFGVSIGSGAVLTAVGQGADVKMLAATVPFNSVSVISQKSDPITTPDDLVGKTIGIPPGSAQELIWPAFIAKNEIDPSSFELVNLAGDALPAALAQGQLDGYVSYAIDLPLLSDVGLDPEVMLLSDFGVVYAPGEGVVVSQQMLDERPDVVRRFLRAIQRTIDFAIANPEEAARIGAEVMPVDIDETVALGILEIINGYRAGMEGGFRMRMEEDDWAATIELLAEYAGLENPLPPSDYYTNDYLP